MGVYNIKWDEIRLIIELGRFQFLVFGFLCFTAGALLAVLLNSPFSWERFLLGYLVLGFAHLSVSYSNDYWDFAVDHYNRPTRFTGGSGILVENPELMPFAKGFAIILIGLSIFLAFIFAFIYSSLTFLVLACVGSALAWYYSAPPLKLSYNGLGEISAIISGFILPTFGYVAITGFLDLKIVLFSLPFMIYMFFFILSVEIPDREGDKKGKKNTFIVKKGRNTGFILIGLSGIMGTLSIQFLSLSGIYSPITFQMIIVASLIPLIVGLYALIRRTETKEAATRLVNLNIPSLVIFILLLDLSFLGILLLN